ncbi:MAG: HDOD domain-containing protein [Oscillibacter sp.]|nr:HDOD domain-containing protein [Oscillibacter sp.]
MAASNKYIVRRPIKDAASRVLGYEILYYGESTLYGAESLGGKGNEFAVADTIYSFLTQNTEKALKGSRNFMTFTTTLLMKKVPRLFEPSDLVIQIDDSVIIHPLAMHFVQQYKREGYQIAVNEFQFVPRYLAMLDDIDYIKINLKSTSDISLHNVIEIANSMGKQCIATDVDDAALYQRALGAHVYGMEGAFVAEKLASKVQNASFLRSNFFRLMSAVSSDEPDIAEIERIISMDATLTYGLLKVANSARYATRNRTTSVQQAMMKLGIEQLRQWVYLLCAGDSEGELDPTYEEFLRLSFQRANFCSELMNYTSVVPISKGEAYLLGMFSTLPYLINAPMEEIMADLPVVREIKNALIYREGTCGALFELVLCYENADWGRVNDLAEQLQIPASLLTTLYFECMEQADELWKSMTENAGAR